ncbi:CPBP family intramembrane metalloprotease [Sphingomonas sp. 36D10-4-7]|uniref:CPBP family intramembrane metalloprotease n=1 Tax=Sphingomonas corticis TaxID=2722791 RepID=A0ABX1CSF3_9SPHN|nr:CPBP family intramembrane metalloprotease [Sphingomonas corticis]
MDPDAGSGMIGMDAMEAGMAGVSANAGKDAARPSLWLVAALLVGQQLVLTLFHYVVAPAIGMAPGSASAIAMTIIVGAMVMAAIVALDLRRTGRARAVLLVAPRWDRATALTMAAALVIAQLPLIWLAANGLTVWQTGQSQHLAVGQALRASADGVWLLVATILAAPVIEEVIYRGYLVGSLIDRMPGVVVVAISAALFVTLHSEAANLVAALCLGIATAICAIRTRSVVPGIVVHAASNAFGLWYGSQS